MFSKKSATYCGIPVKPGTVYRDNQVIPLNSIFINQCLPKVVQWVIVNWDGNAEMILKKSQMSVQKVMDWFSPSDKGGLSAFGVDSHGRIIIGMRLMNETLTPELEAYPTTSADTYGSFELGICIRQLDLLSKRFPKVAQEATRLQAFVPPKRHQLKSI